MIFAGVLVILLSYYLNEKIPDFALAGKGLLFAGITFTFINMGINGVAFKNMTTSRAIILKHSRGKVSDDRGNVESNIKIHEIEKG